MGKYVHKFANQAAYNQARDNNYIEPWVSYTEGKGLNWNKSIYEKMKDEYLTFDILEDGIINWKNTGGAYNRDMKYSINNGSWVNITGTPTTINVSTGDKVRFKASADSYYDWEHDRWWSFYGTTCKFNLYGNSLSLGYSDNFKNYNSFPTRSGLSLYQCGMLGPLFENCVNLIDASHLILPDTVKDLDYWGLFRNCTNLKQGPDLLAKTLANYCYNGMFYNCSSLNYIKCLSTTGGTTNNTANWVYGVAATGTFVKAEGAESWTTDVNGIPSGWTVQTANS